jgi:hypothetical protein
MKLQLNYILLAVVGLITLSCKKDNYEAPTSRLTGKLVYQGVPIEVEYDRVPFEMYQYGFGKVGAINGTITPDGSFSHLLYDGEYKFLVRVGQGPFLWPNTGGKSDTLTISVNGNTTKDIEVKPYYMIRTPAMAHAAGKVNATFKIEKVITDVNAKNIDQVGLFINKTSFVSTSDNIARTQVAGSAVTDPNNVSLSVTIPDIKPVQKYVFARIGVKAAGIEDWIFSPAQQINF